MLKSAAIVLATLITALCQSDYSEDPTDSFSTPVLVPHRATDDKPCTEPFSCLGCKTARVCRPTLAGWVVVKTMSCPAYCDSNSGTCTDIPDESCGDDENDFFCLRENSKFPSRNASNEFTECKNFSAKKFKCDREGHNYNPTTGLCEKNFSGGGFTCKEKGLKVPHSSDAQYYGYCGEDLDVLVVDKCPDHFHLNETSQKCEPHCSKEGALPDPSDCTKYIKCSDVWINGVKYLIPFSMSCAPNTGFDSSQYMCVVLDDLPSCKPSKEQLE